jgi:hypothetical protein
MRKIVTLMAAAGLMAGTAGLAHADPPIYVDNCSHVITVAPNVTAKTCVHAQIATTAYVSANVTLTNNSVYPVTVRADLLFGSTVVPGVDMTIAAGHWDIVWGNAVADPPGGSSNCLGRGYLTSGGWSLYTYSNQ